MEFGVLVLMIAAVLSESDSGSSVAPAEAVGRLNAPVMAADWQKGLPKKRREAESGRVSKCS